MVNFEDFSLGDPLVTNVFLPMYLSCGQTQTRVTSLTQRNLFVDKSTIRGIITLTLGEPKRLREDRSILDPPNLIWVIPA